MPAAAALGLSALIPYCPDRRNCSARGLRWSGSNRGEVSTALSDGDPSSRLFLRDGSGRQQTTALPASTDRLTIGREQGSDIRIEWDTEVSRLHAQLERVGADWVLVDDGLSRNGTYVNGERLTGRRRLRDGDILLVGTTTMTYRSAATPPSPETRVGQDVVTVLALTSTQRSVLEALCRPYLAGATYATPATNQQIAGEVYLSVDSVKTHLRTLFHKFGVEELAQNQKRAKLVELALRSGLVSDRKA